MKTRSLRAVEPVTRARVELLIEPRVGGNSTNAAARLALDSDTALALFGKEI
jgi:hypothetical protein